MKRILAAALIMALAGAPELRSARPKTELQRLARLYEEGRYFELRDALASRPEGSSPELEFLRGAIAQVFNRLDDAGAHLRRYLAAADEGPVRATAKDAWILLADAHRRRGRYREAAAAFRTILERFDSLLDGRQRAVIADQADLWSSLADVPPLEIEIAEDAAIRMTGRSLTVRSGTSEFLAGYDTGSTMSVLHESLAAELGVPLRGPAVRVQTGTGLWVRARVGALAEMRIGPIVVRHAVVLVLPDRLFPSAKAPGEAAQRGLIGAPVLEALGEFTETAAGDFLVPARPRPRPGENMFFSGYMPVVEAVHRGNRIRLCLDTGATTTVLYLPFYNRHRGEINARSRERGVFVGSVGTSRRIAARVLDEFDFRAGGMDLAMKRVMVQTRGTHSDTLNFHGVLGWDLLAHCSRMTLNFLSMTFVLE